MNDILWLEKFYTGLCNGEWEHTYGVAIDTLDNPGWTMTIDLKETQYENALFESISIEKSGTDWMRCWVQNNQFKGVGGPNNLHNIMQIFREWITDIEK